jgi:hypothetical protein
VKRWQKKPYWLRDPGFMGLTAAARGVFVSLYELLADEPVLTGTIAVYARFTGIDRHTLMRAFTALDEAGLLCVSYGEKSVITITDPRATSTRPDVDLMQTSSRPDPNLMQTSYRPDADLMQTSSKPDAKFSTQQSSNDAGFQSQKVPLEENRIDKNRVEENRIDAQSAADKPLISPSPKVKKSTTAVERPDGCDETVWADWLRVRGKNPLTQTAWAGMTSEASKAGISAAEAVKICAERGWRGFRADWLANDRVKRGGRFEPEDLSKQDYRSHDGEKFVAGSAAEYFYGKDYVKRARERYEKPYDRSKEELA